MLSSLRCGAGCYWNVKMYIVDPTACILYVHTYLVWREEIEKSVCACVCVYGMGLLEGGRVGGEGTSMLYVEPHQQAQFSLFFCDDQGNWNNKIRYSFFDSSRLYASWLCTGVYFSIILSLLNLFWDMVLVSFLPFKTYSKASSDPMKDFVSCTRNEVVQRKPELEKESGIQPVVLDCGCFHKLTGCGEHKGDQGNTELSWRVTAFLKEKKKDQWPRSHFVLITRDMLQI